MTISRADLTVTLTTRFPELASRDVDRAARLLIERMSETLCAGERIEIRGFGSFALRYHPPAVKRNPRTGAAVAVGSRFSLHFRPGKALRDRVNGRAE